MENASMQDMMIISEFGYGVNKYRQSNAANKTVNCSMLLCNRSQYQDYSYQITKISGQFQISGQYQDTFEISGISGQLGPLYSLTLYQMICEILRSAHRLSDSCWRLIFSLPISTFSALGVSHVMCYINVRYLLTYLTGYIVVFSTPGSRPRSNWL